ncbi:MAG: superoxide dismutase family protein [Actinomycetota bacterium]|nr:superoxide dismutase family protein [Actinomycetota bacterium]
MARGAALVAALAVGGVAVATTSAAANEGAANAWAVLKDGGGDTVGFARFTEDAAGAMHVNVQVRGLSTGRHGIHVHSIGNCDAAGFTSAGGHHNPSGALHGQHAGDLPNLVVNGAGQGHLNTKLARFTLADGPNAVLGGDGSALVVHALADDYVTDPTGNSGGRIACGVIHPG